MKWVIRCLVTVHIEIQKSRQNICRGLRLKACPFLKEIMRDVRCVLYAGTWPATYTLSFMELMMTGTPVVAIGKGLAENIPGVKAFEFYEVHKIIKNDINGYVSDSIGELRAHLKRLLADHALAKRIGDAGRQTAIDLFGKEQRREEWRKFFESL